MGSKRKNEIRARKMRIEEAAEFANSADVVVFAAPLIAAREDIKAKKGEQTVLVRGLKEALACEGLAREIIEIGGDAAKRDTRIAAEIEEARLSREEAIRRLVKRLVKSGTTRSQQRRAEKALRSLESGDLAGALESVAALVRAAEKVDVLAQRVVQGDSSAQEARSALKAYDDDDANN